jgi:hypothetical protein
MNTNNTDHNNDTAKFSIGDEVNLRYGTRWTKEVFTISHTWYTLESGRQYNVRENGDVFTARNIRLAKK